MAIRQIFQRLWDSDLQDTRIILLMRFDRKATPSACGRLDAALQIGVEGVVAREARFLGDHANVSSLVINNSDRSVLAFACSMSTSVGD